MSLSQLGYEFRPDGMFLIRKTCRHCNEPFAVHALSNGATEQAMYGLCDACEALRQHEAQVGAQKLRILPVETPESKLVGRAERARFWRWLVWALAGFWMAVLLAALWRKL